MIRWVEQIIKQLSAVTMSESQAKEFDELFRAWFRNQSDMAEAKDMPGEIRLACQLLAKQNERRLLAYLNSLDNPQGNENDE